MFEGKEVGGKGEGKGGAPRGGTRMCSQSNVGEGNLKIDIPKQVWRAIKLLKCEYIAHLFFSQKHGL